MATDTDSRPFGLKLAGTGFLVFWSLLALLPLFWIVTMSFKVPLDAFSDNPLQVILGPRTRDLRGGISLSDIVLVGSVLYCLYRVPKALGRRAVHLFSARRLGRIVLLGAYAACLWLLVRGDGAIGFVILGAGIGAGIVWLLGFSDDADDEDGVLGTLISAVIYVAGSLLVLIVLVPAILPSIDAVLGVLPLGELLTRPLLGATAEHYLSVWVERGFYRNFLNTMYVTAGVTAISLTVGTLAGYGLSRSKSTVAFWLLILALVFRSLPHSVLVTGYLPPFIASRDILQPFWDMPVLGWVLGLFSTTPPTLYGQPLAVIAVLVSINQPFTIWMLRSFFQSIPAELDEAARIDGCSDIQAFRRVIMPVMWPGVVTTGLFSFLLAYNDYLICSLLLNSQNQTMVPSITQFFNSETTTTDQVQAVAAAVSITAPLFLLVMAFQKQIVSGLTAGAVKG